jgi:multisubunit Na+/H+ antiporter MnhG subunit
MLLAGPVTAHALASAAYRVGIAQSSQAIRNDLAQATTSRYPSVEETHG